MGLLDQKKEIDSKLKFFWKEDDEEKIIAWVDDYDGSLVIDKLGMNNINQSKAICKWYLSVCEDL